MLRIYIMNFLLAISTTIGMTVIPFLITDSLGLSLLILGILEGVTEFLSNIFRLANGVLFDKIKNKRNIFIFSTGLAFMSKAMLLVPSSIAILFAKLLERVANGTFAAPRDAYVAGEARNKGMALGLLNVSKTFGCVVGPILVSASTFFIGGPAKENLSYYIVACCLLSFPALLFSFTLTVDHVEEKTFSFKELKTVFKAVSPILFLVFIFFLGRFNDGLLMMYLKHSEFPAQFYLATIAIFNGIMMFTAPIIGSQVDKGSLKKIVYATIFALCFFNFCFYHLNIPGVGYIIKGMDIVNWTVAILGLCAWGIQRAGAQIVFSALIFKSVDKAFYGTAIGIFYIVSGFSTFLSSSACGYLAENGHFQWVFCLSGLFGCVALITAFTFLNKGIYFRVPTAVAHAT